MQKTIFVVDDNDINLAMAEEALEDLYVIMTLPSAAKMFALLEKKKPDMILLDIEMPDMNGFDALRELKASEKYKDIPVIFLTSMADPISETLGFELGVVDFVTKPFSTPVLLNRIRTHLQIDMLIKERTAKLESLQRGLVLVLADLLEKRDIGAGGHVERISSYVKLLINAMEKRGVYIEEINQIDLESFISAACLHDVGKITVPDMVLNKPSKLTDDEFEAMKKHSNEGLLIIDRIASQTGETDFVHNAKSFTNCHHECWDGSGYPHGLKGTDIPLQGRIMAIVDVYDALVSERPYKKPFSEDEAAQIIMDNAGKKFDPNIAEVFFEIKDQFRSVKSS